MNTTPSILYVLALFDLKKLVNKELKIKKNYTKSIKTKKFRISFDKVFIFIYVFLLLSAILILLFVPQSNDKIITQVVQPWTETAVTPLRAVISREEILVTAGSYDSNLISYVIADGEKVTIGQPIANIYSSHADVEKISQIKDLLAEKDRLSRIQNQGTLDSASIVSLSKSIAVKYRALCYGVNSGINIGMSQAAPIDSGLQSDLKILLSTKNYIISSQEALRTGDTVENPVNSAFSEQLETVNRTLEAIAGSAENPVYPTPTAVITAPQGGYFIKNTDNFSSQLLPESIQNMSYEEVYNTIENIFSSNSQEPLNPCIGKIIPNFSCYTIGIINTADASAENIRSAKGKDYIRTGNVYKMIINGQPEQINGVIREIIPIDGENSLVYIYFDKLSLSTRQFNADIVKFTGTGIYVPREAQRFKILDENGGEVIIDSSDPRSNLAQIQETGVYIQGKSGMNFRYMDIIYSTDNYIVSAIEHDPESDKQYLEIYDTIIIEGLGYIDNS